MREFEYLEDGAASVEGEGHFFRPWGHDGGGDGGTAELKLVAPDGREEHLPSKLPHRRIAKGERFVCAGPAGGGYGDPKRRDREAVLEDLADGLIDAETAEAVYGLSEAAGD